MPHHEFFWTARAIQKIGDNDLTVDEVEYAVLNAKKAGWSDNGNRPAYTGLTPSGELVFIPFEYIDELTIQVITAFKPKRRR